MPSADPGEESRGVDFGVIEVGLYLLFDLSGVVIATIGEEGWFPVIVVVGGAMLDVLDKNLIAVVREEILLISRFGTTSD